MAARKKRTWGRWVIILLLLGGGAFAFYKYRAAAGKEAITFRTAEVTRGDITQSVTANGQISAVKNVQVGSQISGTIKEISVDFNSRVKAGQIICQIDPSTYERNVEESKAQIASAQAALELSRLNARRATELRSSELLPQAELDQALADLQQAEAALKIRQAALKRAEVDLERTTIYAPIDGVVISRNVEVGQTVAASFNTPTLFVIANDLTRMQIEAAVSEADVGGVTEGLQVEFTVDAYPGRQFEGVVKQVRFAPSTNQNVVSYTTIIDVNNDDLKLRPGMTANASVITAQKENVLRVPNAALRFRPPEGAVVVGVTNVAGRGGTNQGSALAAGSARGGPGGGDREEMRRRFEQMSPEEREQFREKMRARFGGDGPPGGGGANSARRGDGPALRIAYVLSKTNMPGGKIVEVARGVSVRVGIADGSNTEVMEGLNEGDPVITASNSPQTQPMNAMRPPGSPFGGMGMRPR